MGVSAQMGFEVVFVVKAPKGKRVPADGESLPKLSFIPCELIFREVK